MAAHPRRAHAGTCAPTLRFDSTERLWRTQRPRRLALRSRAQHVCRSRGCFEPWTSDADEASASHENGDRFHWRPNFSQRALQRWDLAAYSLPTDTALASALGSLRSVNPLTSHATATIASITPRSEARNQEGSLAAPGGGRSARREPLGWRSQGSHASHVQRTRFVSDGHAAHPLIRAALRRIRRRAPGAAPSGGLPPPHRARARRCAAAPATPWGGACGSRGDRSGGIRC